MSVGEKRLGWYVGREWGGYNPFRAQANPLHVEVYILVNSTLFTNVHNAGCWILHRITQVQHKILWQAAQLNGSPAKESAHSAYYSVEKLGYRKEDAYIYGVD